MSHFFCPFIYHSVTCKNTLLVFVLFALACDHRMQLNVQRICSQKSGRRCSVGTLSSSYRLHLPSIPRDVEAFQVGGIAITPPEKMAIYSERYRRAF
jgi:hypothetical protein